MYQYDLYAANINRSRVHIDTYDGGMAPLWATFFQHKPAPDGKIYAPLECRLYNATGVEVLRETLAPGNVTYPLDLTRFPAGVYISSGARSSECRGN